MIHSHREPPPEDLTRNQGLVYETLRASDRPLGAYAILDTLREEGLKAPLQVYRALDKLVERGLVHRLESQNAFLACRHDGCTSHVALVFAICDHCGSVQEIADPAVVRALRAVTPQGGFRVDGAMVELHGECASCQAARQPRPARENAAP